MVDTRAELAAADIFALASEYEGYGMAFAEALSQGVPVVACRAGAIADLVPAAAGGARVARGRGSVRRGAGRAARRPGRAAAAAERPRSAGRRCRRWSDTAGLVAAALARAASVSFDAAWLDLREPADAAARDPRCCPPRPGISPRRRGRLCSISVAGRDRPSAPLPGASRGALAAGGPDPALLALAAARCGPVETVQADLGAVEALPLEGRGW